MTRKLEGKVALVSGSGRGIGREIAKALAAAGALVAILARGFPLATPAFRWPTGNQSYYRMLNP